MSWVSASWMKRFDEDGPDALVQLPVPVNKFPECVHYVVQRLRTFCPMMDSVKIAQTLARAGLHFGTTTVRRMLKGKPQREPFASNSEDNVCIYAHIEEQPLNW